ncbi:hypothetical protein CDAR_382901 [Caerostris darwini]|uniref:Ribosomal protein S14 n=1 Tax=Caerostris darwini TaxID=1538125 RepID=A0AAV4SLV9_9ARAC|nr:hypothetical protein CDAR_382901 [Caerostris darwini]
MQNCLALSRRMKNDTIFLHHRGKKPTHNKSSRIVTYILLSALKIACSRKGGNSDLCPRAKVTIGIPGVSPRMPYCVIRHCGRLKGLYWSIEKEARTFGEYSGFFY